MRVEGDYSITRLSDADLKAIGRAIEHIIVRHLEWKDAFQISSLNELGCQIRDLGVYDPWETK